MNLIKSIVVIIISIVFFSCSNDDKTSTQTNLPPGDFTVSVEDIATFSAKAIWTDSENNSDSELTYSVYLNDALVVETITGNEFLFSDLESETNYTVKVEAVNDYGNNSESFTFETLIIPQLYANRFYYSNDPCFGDVVFYLPNKKTDSINKWGNLCPPPYFDNIKSKFSYDESDRLVKVLSSGGIDWGTSTANYYYTGNQVSKIERTSGWADALTLDTITYNISFKEYTYITYLSDYEKYLHSKSDNFIVKDGENRLVEHRREFTFGGSADKTYNFSYSNGNLTEISDSSGNIWQVEYDNANSLNTFTNNFGQGAILNHVLVPVAGLYGLNDTELYQDLRTFPDLFQHSNINNPIRYKKNGVIIREIAYEYNQYNYPILIQIEGLNNLVIEYIEL